MTQPPLLEYQSRANKAKKKAVGGTRLLGCGLAFTSLFLLVITLPQLVNSHMADYANFLAIFIVPLSLGIGLIVCSVKMKANSQAAAQLASLFTGATAVSLLLVFISLFSTHQRESFPILFTLFLCALAVLAGIIAVWIEIRRVITAIRRGDYTPLPPD